MRFSKYLILLLILIFSKNSFSQKISFNHLTINDGLSQNAVFSILQDSKGFMWFATKDGLNRYDGKNFVVFQYNPFDTTTVSDNYITTLFEDSRGLIWVGTLSGGVNIFHQDSETFTRLILRSEHSELANINEVKAIAEDSKGKMWIGTKGDGLIQVIVHQEDSLKYSARQFLNKPGNPKSLSHNTISHLLLDQNDELWIANEAGLNRYDPETEKFDLFQFDTKHPEAPGDPNDYRLSSILEMQNGTFWLGTVSGLIKFDRITHKYEYFPNRYEVFRYGWGSVNHIIESESGSLWLGTSTGLMNFDPAAKKYTYYQHDPLDLTSLSFNLVSSLFIDRTGILWVGTSGQGINIYDHKANRFPVLRRDSNNSTRITGFSVSTIFEDRDGFVWISADVLYRWNRDTGELKSFETSSTRPDDFGNTGAYSIIQSSNGMIWMASARGLFRYNPNTKESKLYQNNSLASDSTGLLYLEVNAVYEDQKGTIWIATKNYFSKMTDSEEGTFKHFRIQESYSSKNMTRPVIYQDEKEIFWIGTANGLVRFDPDSKETLNFRTDPSRINSISNNTIKSITPDPFESDKYIWIGTSGGLNKFNKLTGTFEHYTEDDGLPNNVVYGILPGSRGYLWLSTNKGLSRFDLKTETFRNYDVRDGLQSNEFNTGAYYRSRKGELFFGGIAGLNYFFPDSIKDNPHKPEIVLTGLKIGEEPISHKKHPEIAKSSITESRNILLSHKDDVITFDFAALDYSSPDKNQYAYKLDGFNDDWIYSGNNTSATYTNLPHGEFTFRVKGSNNDGVWNEEGTSLAIIVAPPWWKTWWAYIVYSMIILNALYLLRRYELNRFNLRNQLKLERVQSDSLRNLDQLKSEFFANISHEFRTPLTLILGQLENVLSADINIREKKKLKLANKNAKRLLGLINQLLDLSKLEAGKMKLNKDQYNVVSFLKSLVYSFETLAETKNITLVFDSELESFPLRFDAEKMEIVFLNLISNAFKFTNSGGTIGIYITMPMRDKIEIKVHDTGIGIPQDRLPHIFDRFYQVDGSDTRAVDGSGIGLALVHEFVKLHGGKVTVSSKHNEKESEGSSGTSFIISLPYVEADDIQEKASKPYSMINKDYKANFIEASSMNEAQDLSLDIPSILSSAEIVLIVEDNDEVRIFIKEQLENDYKILEAGNGVEGIAISQNEIPDLIITDLMMPEMDGYDFCKSIRSNEKTSHIPLIMLTAKAGLEHKLEGFETGIDAFLTKPFKVKELQVRVRKLIQQRKKLREQFGQETFIQPSKITDTSIDQRFLEKVIASVEKHFEDDQFKVDDLAADMNMSTSQLNRKLNALIGQPAGKLINSLKLERAANLLKQSDQTVAEISYKIGYSDQAYFSRVFKKQFGESPSEFRDN